MALPCIKCVLTLSLEGRITIRVIFPLKRNLKILEIVNLRLLLSLMQPNAVVVANCIGRKTVLLRVPFVMHAIVRDILSLCVVFPSQVTQEPLKMSIFLI